MSFNRLPLQILPPGNTSLSVTSLCAAKYSPKRSVVVELKLREFEQHCHLERMPRWGRIDAHTLSAIGQKHELFRMLYWKHPQGIAGIDQVENRGVRADTQPQCQNRYCCEYWTLAQRPQGIAAILNCSSE